MPKKKMWVEWEDGAELSRSRKQPGDYSPLTRDGEHNLGHVVLSDVDDDEYEWQVDPEWRWHIDDDGERAQEGRPEELLAALVILGIIAAAERSAPHIKRWWHDHAVPFMKRSRKRSSREGGERGLEPVVARHTLEPTPVEPSQDAIVALDGYGPTMSSAEARERLVLALVARLFSDEQVRVLRSARISDDDALRELTSTLAELTPQQVGEGMMRMLEANPSWTGDATLAELEAILERRSQELGQPVRAGQRDTKALPPTRRLEE